MTFTYIKNDFNLHGFCREDVATEDHLVGQDLPGCRHVHLLSGINFFISV